MNQAEKYDRIERYLAGELTGEERSAFEAGLRADPALRAEVDLHREAAEVLGGEKVHAFRCTLAEVDADWRASGSAGRVLPLAFRWVAGVAAGLLLLVAAYFLFRPGPSAADLFATHFEPYPMVLVQRSFPEGDPELPGLEQAMTDYSEGRYNVAAAAFRQLSEQAPANPAFRFYHGLSALAAGDPATAAAELRFLLDQSGHLFTEQSRWYLALAYLQLDDRPAARDLLRAIGPDDYQYQAARAILAEMGS